jgi:hypothetical protein
MEPVQAIQPFIINPGTIFIVSGLMD